MIYDVINNFEGTLGEENYKYSPNLIGRNGVKEIVKTRKETSFIYRVYRLTSEVGI